MTTAIALLLLFSAPSFTAECNQELAKEVGIKAIKSKFPNEHKEHKLFAVAAGKQFWFVVPSVVGKYSRGGGAPEAVIEKKSCKVVRVSLAK